MRLKAMVAATLLGTFTPSYAGDAEPIDTALSEAEEIKGLRFSYTMTFEWPGESPVAVRYNANTKKFSTINGDPDALPDKARQKLKNIKKSESVPGGLLYADFREYLDDISLLEETDDQYVYRFIPSSVDQDDVTESAQNIVHARLYVSKENEHLARYEVKGLKPFKPNAASKMEEFEVVQDFERLGPDGPPVLVRLYSKQKGKQLFRNVDTEFTATFSDFEPVE